MPLDVPLKDEELLRQKGSVAGSKYGIEDDLELEHVGLAGI